MPGFSGTVCPAKTTIAIERYRSLMPSIRHRLPPIRTQDHGDGGFAGDFMRHCVMKLCPQRWATFGQKPFVKRLRIVVRFDDAFEVARPRRAIEPLVTAFLQLEFGIEPIEFVEKLVLHYGRE